MAVTSGENTTAVIRFKASLRRHIAKSGKTQQNFADGLKMPASSLKNFLSPSGSFSLGKMEEIADKLGLDLADMLAEGRDILANNDKPMEETDVLSESTTYLDHDLIIRVVVILEDFLKQQKKWLDSENKAKAFIQMYEARKEHEANGGTVEDSYTLLLPILSEALTHAVDEPLQKTG